MMQAAELLQLLGSETWRLYVDLDRQHLGSAAFDEGLRGVREPGFLASMLAAHHRALGLVGEPLDARALAALHDDVLGHAPEAPRTWRNHASWVGVPRAGIEPRVRARWDVWGVRLDPVAPTRPGYVRLVLAPPPTATTWDERLDACLQAGQQHVRDAAPEGKLLAIAQLHQDLELLHPTADANTRRHLLVLQKLLVEAGFPPALLTEPNHVYGLAPRSWARCLQEGIERTRAVHHALQRGMDVPAMLRSFDIAHRPQGVEHGRFHQIEAAQPRYLA
ncbi:MAG: hypothetical protein H6806_10415 [Planctomycetes bacterium]|nr:hypothetical protein [Planctomycetota bacterium]MCB9825420.1 hypothetical protein [Planctomycetota bacterium]MCB9830159.1 hypothetical protein [Planctomycetota bacterium]